MRLPCLSGLIQKQKLEELNQFFETNHPKNTIDNINNTFGVVIMGKDKNTVINTGHSLFYVKDSNGNITYYENTTSNYGFSGGVRKLTEEEYTEIYGNRKFVTKEFKLNQEKYDNLIEYVTSNQNSYNIHFNNCIQFVNKSMEEADLNLKTRDLFTKEELESIEIGEWFYNYHNHVPDKQEMPEHDIKNIGRNLKNAFNL